MVTTDTCAQMIKYGVIGAQLLYDDLQHWDSLYIAGRVQKPVLMLKDYAKLPIARKNNLDAAFTMALLLLPEQFSLQACTAGVATHLHAQLTQRVSRHCCNMSLLGVSSAVVTDTHAFCGAPE